MKKLFFFKTKKLNLILLQNKKNYLYNSWYFQKFINIFLKKGLKSRLEKNIYNIFINIQLKYNLPIPLLLSLIFEKLRLLFFFKQQKSFKILVDKAFVFKPYYSFLIILKIFKKLKKKKNKQIPFFFFLKNELEILISEKYKEKSILYKEYKNLNKRIEVQKSLIDFRWKY